ncbi:MAG: TlpA family protein disulfide reductase [Isosphaeraceae bacterium]
MSSMSRQSWAVAVLAGFMAIAPLAMGADRSVEEILKALDTVKMPTVDRSKVKDPEYVAKFRSNYRDSAEKRDTLILQLHKADPDNAKLGPLMAERWSRMVPFGPDASKREREIEEVLDHSKNPQVRLEAAFAKAQGGVLKARETGSVDFSGLDQFIKLAPKDERGARLLYTATFFTADEKGKEKIEDRILKEFPDSSIAASVNGLRRRKAALGKPFDLEFTDAIGGSTISIKGLKGKVVVLDFWATWCGPCVAEMPHMKELYAEYHGKGVEFIGISLDFPKEDGGLDNLKKFVKEKQIPWPQYYQGNYWDSEFSRSWGINSIPAMFVVDSDGKLYSEDAGGKLDRIIPELLKKRSAAGHTPAGGGE